MRRRVDFLEQNQNQHQTVLAEAQNLRFDFMKSEAAQDENLQKKHREFEAEKRRMSAEMKKLRREIQEVRKDRDMALSDKEHLQKTADERLKSEESLRKAKVMIEEENHKLRDTKHEFEKVGANLMAENEELRRQLDAMDVRAPREAPAILLNDAKMTVEVSDSDEEEMAFGQARSEVWTSPTAPSQKMKVDIRSESDEDFQPNPSGKFSVDMTSD
jgi:chromosome segregation ATPase